MARTTLTDSEVFHAIQEWLDTLRVVDVKNGDSSETVSLRSIDRIREPEGQAATNLHMGYDIELPETANTDEYRDRNMAHAQDRVVIRCYYRIHPQAQKLSRNAACAMAEQIRLAMTDMRWPFGRIAGIHWRRTTRNVRPEIREYYTIEQDFILTRDIALSGGTHA